MGNLGRYAGQRVLLTLAAAFGVLVLVFLLLHLTPGDPVEVMLGENAAAADRAALRHELHLDEPLLTQFGLFLSDFFQGKLNSLYYHRPVMAEVKDRFLATAELAAAALFLSLIFAVPLGILAAVKKGGGVDAAAMGFSLVGVSLPSFWLGPMLILFFSIKLQWLPVSGRGGLAHLCLPALTLGLGMAAMVSRMVRGSLLDVMRAEYLRVARAKGLPERRVVLRHALRNALIPVITVIGLQAGALLSGAIITETIFAWPGLGRLVIDGIRARDFPLVQGTVIVIALTYVLINLITDLLYAVADPRIRFGGGQGG